MHINTRRLVSICLLAMLAWSGTVLYARVWAGWFPPRPDIELNGFLVADSNQSNEKLSVHFPIHSSHPECLSPQGTVLWSDFGSSAVVEDSTLRWSVPENEARFQVATDCLSPSELIVRPVWLTSLPWGVAQSSSSASLAEGGSHIISLRSQPTEVQWFVPDESAKYHVELRPLSSFEVSETLSVEPLISSWWQGGNTSGCHTGIQILLPGTPCISGWWQRFRNTTALPSQIPAAPQPGEVVISEVNWAGTFGGGQNTPTDEWMELANLSPEAISLGGLKIYGVRANNLVLTIDTSVIIPPYGTVVISRLQHFQSGTLSQVEWTTPQLALSNTEAQIVLALPDGTELDRTPSGPWLVGKNITSTPFLRASAQRLPGTVGLGDDWDSWMDCSAMSEEFCQKLALRSQKPSALPTWATPGMIFP